MPDKEISRRKFLRDAGVLLGGAALSSMVLTGACSPKTSETPTTTITSQIPGVVYSPDVFRENRIPPGQHEVTHWPQVQAGGTPAVNLDEWRITIKGLVEPEISLKFNEISALKYDRVLSDIHCVTRWTRLNNLWGGYLAETLVDLVTVKPEARFVIISAVGGFTANVPIAEFLQPDVIFAVKQDDAPLTPEHGGPIRIVIPRLYFWKSAKWVTGIEFTAEDQPGFWEKLGYNNHGDPWLEERYSFSFGLG